MEDANANESKIQRQHEDINNMVLCFTCSFAELILFHIAVALMSVFLYFLRVEFSREMATACVSILTLKVYASLLALLPSECKKNPKRSNLSNLFDISTIP